MLAIDYELAIRKDSYEKSVYVKGVLRKASVRRHLLKLLNTFLRIVPFLNPNLCMHHSISMQSAFIVLNGGFSFSFTCSLSFS